MEPEQVGVRRSKRNRKPPSVLVYFKKGGDPMSVPLSDSSNTEINLVHSREKAVRSAIPRPKPRPRKVKEQAWLRKFFNKTYDLLEMME